MKKLITLILIACSFSSFGQVYKTVTMALDTAGKTAKLRAGTQTYNLTDTFKNYQQIQDGLISGGSATIGTGSVTIDTAYYRINKVNHQSLPRTFTGIANSASGTQYYILVYGKSDNTLDTLQGVQDTTISVPNPPSGTVSINTILVGDGGVEQAEPDLSGYAKLNGGNSFTGIQVFNSNAKISGTSQPTLGFDVNGIGRGGISVFNDRMNFYGVNDAGNSSFRYLDFTRATQHAKFFGTVEGIDPVNSQDFVTLAYGNANYSGGGAPDTTIYRTVANSYSLASGQPRLVSGTNIKTINSTSLLGSGDIATEVPLTFGYGLTRSTNTITADTTSGTGLVSKTRLTGALGSKLNTNGSGASLTNVVNSITGTTNQVVASASTGAVTLSLPQSIATSSTPQFARLGLGSVASASTNLLLPAGTTSISSLRLPNGVAPTSPISGDIWGLTTGVRLQRYDGTNTKDFIFDKTNSVFSGLGNTAIVGDNSGNLSAVPLVNYLTDNNLSKTANYTITLTDFGANGQCTVFADATSGAVTITLPSASTMTGLTVNVIKTDSGVNTVTVSGGATNINSATTSVLATQFLTVRIKSNGTQFYIL